MKYVYVAGKKREKNRNKIIQILIMTEARCWIVGFISLFSTLKIFIIVKKKSMTFKSINFMYMLPDISLVLAEEMELSYVRNLKKTRKGSH